MEFDIGVLSFSYDSAGELLQNIMILDRGQANAQQTHIVNREYLLSAAENGHRIYLMRENKAVNRSRLSEEMRYSRLRPILTLKVKGKLYLKATTDTSECDDLG